MKFGTTELLIILVIIIVIFGPTQIPKLRKAIKKSKKGLKKNSIEAKETVKENNED